jgi:hypothetical protein
MSIRVAANVAEVAGTAVSGRSRRLEHLAGRTGMSQTSAFRMSGDYGTHRKADGRRLGGALKRCYDRDWALTCHGPSSRRNRAPKPSAYADGR